MIERSAWTISTSFASGCNSNQKFRKAHGTRILAHLSSAAKVAIRRHFFFPASLQWKPNSELLLAPSWLPAFGLADHRLQTRFNFFELLFLSYPVKRVIIERLGVGH